MMIDVRKVNSERFHFLEVLYEEMHAMRGALHLLADQSVRKKVGLDPQSFERAFRFLSSVGLVQGTLHGGVGITTQGIITYEAAATEPEKPTAVFPPINVFYAENVNNSTIQQAGNDSDQSANVTSEGESE